MAIYTIPLSVPFLDALADGILKRYPDAIALSEVTILLPNRRSCRGLQEAFYKLSHGKSTILPSIMPIGDLEEEKLVPDQFSYAADQSYLEPVSQLEQHILLAKLIYKWQQQEAFSKVELDNDAMSLAIELAGFLNEVHREQAWLERLDEIVPDNLAEHWQMILQFLGIIVDHWPTILEEQGKIDFTTYQNQVLQQLATKWKDAPPKGPVIAAGSTGSIPAVGELLQTIAGLENGMVVLSNLDQEMDTETYTVLDPVHPQYGLKQFLEKCNITPTDVLPWQHAVAPTCDISRLSLVSEAMRPAKAVMAWQEELLVTKKAFDGITYVESKTLQEEATVISLMMREVLEEKEKTAVLVTHNFALAKRVSSTLQRWDVTVDSSIGQEIGTTYPMIFMQLIADLAVSKIAPIPLLALLKHPLCSAGEDRGEFLEKVRKMEKEALRGGRPEEGFQGLVKKLRAKGDPDLVTWVISIKNILNPLLQLFEKDSVPFSKLLEAHIASMELLAEDNHLPGKERLWSGDIGEQCVQALEELVLQANKVGTISPSAYPVLFKHLLKGKTYRTRFGNHPRLAILSPLEARLQNFDLVILGSLNEGSWPGTTNVDPWMSCSMRENLGLPLPEQNIGKSAHDFVGCFGAKEVVLSRAQKEDGKPTVASRWLLRLQTVMHKSGYKNILQQTQPWQEWAMRLNFPEVIQPISPPEPKPPLAARPTKLSVTQIEKLLKDPYVIYAEKILGLKKLKDIDAKPGPLEFGNFIHAVFDYIVQNYDDLPDNIVDQRQIASRFAEQWLEKETITPSLKTFWWERLNRVIGWFLENEKKRQEKSETIYSEQWDEKEFPLSPPFTLTAKSDRIEVLQDNRAIIVDYKTGTLPSATDIRLGYAPQMVLEAIILSAQFSVQDMCYWRVTGGDPSVEEYEFIEKIRDKNIKDLMEEAEEGVVALIQHFQQETSPYLSQPDPTATLAYNDYTHLARVKEWDLCAA